MKKPSIIILHGWRLSGDKYNKLQEAFRLLSYKVYAPDLPGFGKNISKKTTIAYRLEDLAKFVKDFISTNRLEDVVLVGHSLGGRVIVKYLNLYGSDDILAIVLTGSPLIRKNLTLRKRLGLIGAWIGKKTESILPGYINSLLREKARFLIYKLLGEWDYYNAGSLRETLVNILEDDPERYIADIKVPTLILWGGNDRITPVSQALALHSRVVHSKLVIVPDATHRLPYEKEKEFAREVDSFLKRVS